MHNNVDKTTIEGFGDEWERFDQSALSLEESFMMFEGYFSIFPWEILKPDAVGFDLGCGSGRWAKLVAPRVGKLHCIDPSSAINIARRNLKENLNCEFHHSGVDLMPLLDESMDFGYSLGVLHHVPDTQKAMSDCVRKLKSGAPFLLYLYYAFDNRPFWFRVVCCIIHSDNYKFKWLFQLLIVKSSVQLLIVKQILKPNIFDILVCEAHKILRK